MSPTLLPTLVRPYLLHELPGWGRIFDWLGLGGIDNLNPRWRNAPTRRTRGKSHGYAMELDLGDDLERAVYFIGRYYDLELQLLLDEILKPGDTFIDVGANIGMTTLHAASRVGAGGRVYAFEPQPDCCAKIRKHIDMNNISHIKLHNVGLGDASGTVTMKVLGRGSIMATLCIDEQVDGPNVREEIQVSVCKGDDLIGDEEIEGDLMLKIDVEGYELHVLRGFERTIRRHSPPILIEIEPRYLRRAGVDEHQVFEFFRGHSYQGYAVTVGGTRRMRKPNLRRVDSPEQLEGICDVLWLSGTYPWTEPLVGENRGFK